MNQFLLFAGAEYYPAGGCGDLIGSFETYKAAQTYYEEHKSRKGWDWWHVLDLLTGEYE